MQAVAEHPYNWQFGVQGGLETTEGTAQMVLLVQRCFVNEGASVRSVKSG